MENQEIIVFSLAALAVIYLLWRFLKLKTKKVKKAGCDTECGCH